MLSFLFNFIIFNTFEYKLYINKIPQYKNRERNNKVGIIIFIKISLKNIRVLM